VWLATSSIEQIDMVDSVKGTPKLLRRARRLDLAIR
jgi:hypothetical protein